ncbi:substrate-binding domain-containing protein [Anaerotignum sp. MB30-C6]|uniref:substrate-binding domain-containing protein n=1 Tax=Anaerotignum sp. MB30-C6 TaxID=3070814 RepID=UPI0027DC91DB|nr:substrate-binding domain-containing protein [Anaerotignum sp. MB30-C6]WMI80277.1 substrate-binding domain-containing protein [Anaerotignum sp. MB30-C6]
MKKKLGLGLVMLMLTSALVGCGGSSDNGENTGADTGAEASGNAAAITVVSREDGSGTRGAFIELFGVEEKDAEGTKVDYTADTAEITNSTAVMMQTIAGNKNAIGYISLGSLNDTVKALEIDGAAATVDNIKSGTYKISRPFNIATKDEVTPAAQDFINFIMSEEGQAVVEENGYISQGNTGAYAASDVEGKVTVAGSSSVSPVMEKLKEAYAKVNTSVTVEVQQSDSTTGMTSTIEGICDFGMASRALKDSELEKGLTPTVIAMDGIAVIVNNENSVNGLASAQVKDIFTGVATDWSIAE